MEPDLGNHQRRSEAAEEFSRRTGRHDAQKLVINLAEGLTFLCSSLYARLHFDVEREVGRDSMMMPISELKTEKRAKSQIELFQVAVSAATATARGYIGREDPWYVPWLTRLRVGEPEAEDNVAERVEHYLSKDEDARRLAFTDVLSGVLPESRQAPLVVFSLFPAAVAVATSLAFGDRAAASEDRKRQKVILPAIADCRRCRGKLLENGEFCRDCGNPLWKYDWLISSD